MRTFYMNDLKGRINFCKQNLNHSLHSHKFVKCDSRDNPKKCQRDSRDVIVLVFFVMKEFTHGNLLCWYD